jgi:hypothetical protein
MILDSTLFGLSRQLDMFPQSRFGSVRKHDIHTGVDIYCAEETIVIASEPGEVISVEQFTGRDVGSPWWNDTWAVVIKTETHYALYGEILPYIFLDKTIRAGQPIGAVIPVLKKDKGINPLTMLHFEMYTETPVALEWKLGEPKPTNLIDPTEYLLKLFCNKRNSYGKDTSRRVHSSQHS